MKEQINVLEHASEILTAMRKGILLTTQDVDSSFHGANKDYHTAYYGEIVSAYIIKE